MQFTTLGRTGLKVSVAGLGCGGNSMIGKGAGASDAEAIALVRDALDLGVNFLDTAEAYGTEELVGQAVAGSGRDSVVISTKTHARRGDEWRTPEQVVAALDASLRRLRMDYVDVYNLHGVHPSAYDHAVDILAPALLREKQKGKIRHLGITENGPGDLDQIMLQRAVQADCWDVIMLAYNMMNQGARRDLFPHTQKKGIGTLLMFVVRNIFSQPGLLAQTMKALAEAGRIPKELAAQEDPLGFLVNAGGASSLTDAAYRFVRHEPGVDVVLFGTSKRAHLRANIASILKPPLPKADVEKLYTLFAHLKGVGLDLPNRMQAAKA
jgi:aryl-alcohol dehydrogenase-like predicted oxidoreductase